MIVSNVSTGSNSETHWAQLSATHSVKVRTLKLGYEALKGSISQSESLTKIHIIYLKSSATRLVIPGTVGPINFILVDARCRSFLELLDHGILR